MRNGRPCSLCDPALGPVVHESVHWRLVLNRNQDLLGKCFLAARRHVEAVPELTFEEWRDLHGQMRARTEALRVAFAPEHFNYVFLQNQDRHVHLHVIPRYAGERRFAGQAFGDPGYPGHYRVSDAPRLLDPELRAELARRLGEAIAAGGGSGPD